MPEKVVVESIALASHSPWIVFISTYSYVGRSGQNLRFTHVGLELNELEATAVHFNDLLGVLLFLSLVGLRSASDGGSVGFLCVVSCVIIIGKSPRPND